MEETGKEKAAIHRKLGAMAVRKRLSTIRVLETCVGEGDTHHEALCRNISELADTPRARGLMTPPWNVSALKFTQGPIPGHVPRFVYVWGALYQLAIFVVS